MMRILWLAPEWPYPMTGGGYLRVGHMLSEVCRLEDITFLAGLALPRTTDGIRCVPGVIRERVRYEVVLRRSTVPSRLRKALNLLSGRPYLSVIFGLNKLRHAATTALARQEYDVIVVEHTHCLPALPRRTRAPVVVVVHNVEAQRWQSLVDTRRGYRLLTTRWEARRVSAAERRGLGRCRAAVAVSAQDADRLRAMRFGGPVEVIPHGADVEGFAGLPDPSCATDVLFCGQFSYPPNAIAAQRLARMWLRVRAEHPFSHLLLVGRGASAVASLANEVDGIEVHPDVSSVQPFYARAALVALPVQEGGGAAVKVMEACAAGRPIVGSSFVLEPYGMGGGGHVRKAESDEDYVGAIAGLLRNGALRDEMGRHARRLAEAHTWARQAERFRSFLRRVVADARG